MKNIGVIIGSAFLNDPDYKKFKSKAVKTDYGNVKIKVNKNVYYLQRHGKNTPPHMINHKANIQALYNLGVKNIIAVNSCASCRKAIKPGMIMISDDYIDLLNTHTFFDRKIKFTMPGINSGLREVIIKVAKQNKIKIINKGIYWQTRGPRFETKIEIKLIAQFADIVGMTMANEATLTAELGIKYASICAVDHYAHGVETKQLTIEEFYKGQNKMQHQVKKLLDAVLIKLGITRLTIKSA